MYSDNTDRHLSPSWGEVDRFQREAYQWDDITDVGENESPQMIWNAHYLAVNTANEVLSFIGKQKDQSAFRAQSGEAKLCRAYAMLCLANVFCEAYDPATAASHLGLPTPRNRKTARALLINVARWPSFMPTSQGHHRRFGRSG